MKILDHFFKTKQEDRPVLEIPKVEQASCCNNLNGPSRLERSNATNLAMSFVKDFSEELHMIRKMDFLLSRPIVKEPADVIKISNFSLSWIPGKKLCVLFNLDGDPLCAYFEDII